MSVSFTHPAISNAMTMTVWRGLEIPFNISPKLRVWNKLVSIFSGSASYKFASTCRVVMLVAALCLNASGVVHADSGAPRITPANALQVLRDGNRRYVQNRVEHPSQRPSDAP